MRGTVFCDQDGRMSGNQALWRMIEGAGYIWPGEEKIRMLYEVIF